MRGSGHAQGRWPGARGPWLEPRGRPAGQRRVRAGPGRGVLWFPCVETLRGGPGALEASLLTTPGVGLLAQTRNPSRLLCAALLHSSAMWPAIQPSSLPHLPEAPQSPVTHPFPPASGGQAAVQGRAGPGTHLDQDLRESPPGATSRLGDIKASASLQNEAPIPLPPGEVLWGSPGPHGLRGPKKPQAIQAPSPDRSALRVDVCGGGLPSRSGQGGGSTRQFVLPSQGPSRRGQGSGGGRRLSFHEVEEGT